VAGTVKWHFSLRTKSIHTLNISQLSTRRKRCVGTIAQHKRHDSFYEMGLSSEVYEVIIVANGCVYRENVLNDKCFFSLQLREAKVARRNSTCLTELLRTHKAKLLRGDP